MSLWLCIQLPQLPLEALNADASRSVVYAQHGSRRWVVGSTQPRIGLGEALGSVQARFPDLRVLPRDTAAEAAALQAVAFAAYGLGDRIAIVVEAPRGLFDTPWLAVSVDVGPSLKLFGGIDGLMARAQALLEPLPYRMRIGVAPSFEGAAVAARAGLAPIVEDSNSDWTRQLSHLPIAMLRWPVAAESVLAGSGHETLADVRRHGASTLASRLGQEFPRALQRLFGQLPDPRPWFVPPARYRRRFDLDAEIDDWQALLFPLRRLFDEFESYLRARQVTTSQLTLTLARRRSEGERFVLRTTAPTQSAAVFHRLLRERWTARGPSAAATELRLSADRFAPLAPPQAGLFDDDETSGGEAWNGLIDRLRARLGDTAIWQPGLADDHRPEHAWSPDGSLKPAGVLPPRPFWLLRHPRPWTPRTPLAAAERIVGGWWDDSPIERDYYRSVGAEGESLWVYRDGLDGRWYLQGLEFGDLGVGLRSEPARN